MYGSSMKIISDVSQFKGGWFVGNFNPSAYKTDAVEVCYKKHAQGEVWASHYHAIADEVNYLIEGQMELNGQELSAPCVFIISAGEISKPTFLTDVSLIVVKIPGILNDKYEVKEE